MEKKQDSKADYFFGSKPVLERAEDENEFEGSLTTSTELTNLAFIHDLPSAFWRSIWLEFANQGRFHISDPNFEIGELGFIANPKFEASRPWKLWNSPIWRMGGETAKYKGWSGWEDVSFFSVFELIGFDDLKEVVKSFIWAHASVYSPSFTVPLSEMQHDPADLVHIRSWGDLWSATTNGRRHEIDTVVKNTDGPEQVVCFRFGNNTKLWFAKKERVFYVVWTADY